MSEKQLLEDAGLTEDGGVTYAALVLLGSKKGLGRHLAQAEVIFEYRSNEASTPYQERREYREGLLSFHDDLWEEINKRNDIQSFQSGFFRNDVPTFNERAVREALLNAVGHRDYQHPSSVFVKQYPHKLTVVSLAGCPPASRWATSCRGKYPATAVLLTLWKSATLLNVQDRAWI